MDFLPDEKHFFIPIFCKTNRRKKVRGAKTFHFTTNMLHEVWEKRTTFYLCTALERVRVSVAR